MRPVLAVALTLILTTAALADPPTTQPADPEAPVVLDASPVASLPDTARSADPTQASPRLRAILAGSTAGPGRYETQEPVLPRMTKRAFIQIDGSEPEALIEIEGMGLVSVRQASLFSVATAGVGLTLTFKVTRLAADGIDIEGTDTAEGRKITIR